MKKAKFFFFVTVFFFLLTIVLLVLFLVNDINPWFMILSVFATGGFYALTSKLSDKK